MTSKLVVNTIEADTGISSVSFASSISLSSTSVFHFSDAGVNIGADTNISRAGNGILAFNINSSEKVRIDSNGRLSIGGENAGHFYSGADNLVVADFSADAGISIFGGGSNKSYIAMGSTTFGTGALEAFIEKTHGNNNPLTIATQVGNSNIELKSANDFVFSSYSGPTERFRIDSNGKIGVGGAPSAWQASTISNVLQLGTACLFNYNNDYFHVGQNFYWDGSNYKYVANDPATRLLQDNGQFTFYGAASGSADANISWTERFRIDSNGNIMTSGNVNVSRSSNAGTPLTVRGPADGDAIRIERAGSYQWFIGNDTTAGKSNLYFKANNTKEVVFPSTGGIAFNGEAADNNALNDYEEGSWNPTYTTQGGSAGSVSYSAQNGYYIKIGHTVWVMIDITISSASGMSGNTVISGFPFQNNVRQGQGYYYSGTMNWYIQNHSSSSPIFTGWMIGNASSFRMHNGSQWGSLGNAPLNTTGRLSFSLWYTTNS